MPKPTDARTGGPTFNNCHVGTGGLAAWVDQAQHPCSYAPNLGDDPLTILLAGAPSTVCSTAEMRHRRSHIFTPEAIQLVHRLADQGRTASEIADAIGSTAASVRARCCQLKIKLARGTNGGVSGTPQGPIQEQKLIVRLQPKAYAALEGKAVCIQKSTNELAGMLLEAIVGSEIYDAVLDDGE